MPLKDARRLLWILNHKTLMPDEVGIIRELGWRVFTPRLLPKGIESRSTCVEAAGTENLEIFAEALDVLNQHNFYESPWPPVVSEIVNAYFDVVVTAFYDCPLASALDSFGSLIVARAFGREIPMTYDAAIADWRLQDRLPHVGGRFIFGQAYDHLSEVEGAFFRERAVTLPIPRPSWMMAAADTWHGSTKAALFFCPMIEAIDYYRKIYEGIKRDFADIPHLIFGRQKGPALDPSVRADLEDTQLQELYAACRVFVYPSVEPRHLHYAPLEAMIAGAPVLYLKGSLLDRETASQMPGCCADVSEMRDKSRAIISGKSDLAEKVRFSQRMILDRFSKCRAIDAWRGLLEAVKKN